MGGRGGAGYNAGEMKIRILLNCAVTALLILLTASFGGRAWLGVVDTLERQTFDWRLERNTKTAQKNEDIVIVDIDRDSLRAVGGWPWRRDAMAGMLDQLFDRYQARAVAFTFPFPLPDDESVKIFQQLREEMDEGDFLNDSVFAVRRLDLLGEKFDFDGRFVQAMRGRAVLLGYAFDKSARVEGRLPPSAAFYSDGGGEIASGGLQRLSKNLNYYRGYRGNLEELLDASSGAGHVNFIDDSDGFVRRSPMVVSHAKKIYESLALAILQRADNPGQTLRIVAEGNAPNRGDINSLMVGRNLAPVNAFGEVYFNFLGSGGPQADYENSPDAVFRYVSAHDVLSGRAEREHLLDKIILIGSSSEALRDLYPTPVNSNMPGAELLATQIVNIKDGQVLHRPASADLWMFLMLAGLGLLMAVVFAFFGPVLTFGVTAILSAGFVYAGVHFWDSSFQVVDMVRPLFIFVGLFLWNSISGFVFEWRASRSLQDSFGQYVPPELAKRISSSQSVSMDGESRELSVLFSDVRNFTAISEKFSPQELTRLMNRMLTALSEAIYEHGGTVDKFIGDAVMAFWNAPLEDAEHARHAVLSAIAMQKAMDTLAAQLREEGHGDMKLGIGICSGPASVGNMGSKLRVAYTAMGDTVNVAARVEGLTKYYKVGVLVTDSTYQMCEATGIAFRVVDQVRVKGREKPLLIYQPIGDSNLISPEERAGLELFEEMRTLYTQGDFAAATAKLTDYRRMNPSDGLAEVYEERLQAFAAEPPAEWDGVTNFEVK